MLNVNVPKDCGNAPKKEVLVAFITALCNGDITTIHAQVSDDICFRQVGVATFQGAAFEKWVSDFQKPAIKTLNVKTVLTHGRQGAVEGTVSRTDGKHFGFCAVCRFVGSLRAIRVGAVDWYLLPIPKKEIS